MVHQFPDYPLPENYPEEAPDVEILISGAYYLTNNAKIAPHLGVNLFPSKILFNNTPF